MFLESPRVKLRSLDMEDTEAFYQWAGDREVTEFSLSAYAYPQSRADIAKWLSEINHSTKNVSFGICCTDSGQLIGYAGLSGISTLNRCGEYFILIGSREYWGQGLGTETTRLIVSYGFNHLGLHRIELTAYATNPAAIRAYEKAGFSHEGVKRQAGFRNGKF